MDDPVEKMLAELRGQGAVDSEGRFTLNPVRAREMLRRFQLESPFDCALHLVCYAVAAGAHRVCLDTTETGLWLEHDGQGLSLEALNNPLGALLSRKIERQAERELAIALNSWLANPRNEIELRGDGQRVTVKADLESFVPTPCESRENRVSVQSDGPLVDPASLKEALQFCPVPVELDGQTISTPFECGPCAAWFLLRSEFQEPGVNLRVEPGQADYFEQATCPVRLSAFFRIGGASGGRLFLLHHGRLYSRRLEWSLQGLEAEVDVVVASDRLRRDLTQRELLIDKRFANLQSYLSRELTQFLARMARQCPTLGGDTSTHSLPLMTWLVSSLSRAGQWNRAYELQMSICKWWRDRGNSLELGLAWFRLGLLARAWGREDEGQALARRSVSCWHALGGSIRIPGGGGCPRDLYLDLLKLETHHQLFGQARQDKVFELISQASQDNHDRITARACRLLLEGGELEPLERKSLVRSAAQALYRLEEASDAIPLFRELVAVEKVPSVLADVHEKLGVLLAECDELPSARDHLLIAVAEKKKAFGDKANQLAPTLTRLALVSDRLGERSEANRFREWASQL